MKTSHALFHGVSGGTLAFRVCARENECGIESDKSAGNIIFVNRGLGVKNPGRFHL